MIDESTISPESRVLVRVPKGRSIYEQKIRRHPLTEFVTTYQRAKELRVEILRCVDPEPTLVAPAAGTKKRRWEGGQNRLLPDGEGFDRAV